MVLQRTRLLASVNGEGLEFLILLIHERDCAQQTVCTTGTGTNQEQGRNTMIKYKSAKINMEAANPREK